MCYFYIKSYSATNITCWEQMTSERNHNKGDQLVLRKRGRIYMWGTRLTNLNMSIYEVGNGLNKWNFYFL